MRTGWKRAAAGLLTGCALIGMSFAALAGTSPVIAAGSGGRAENGQAEDVPAASPKEDQMTENGLGIRIEDLDAAKDAAVERLVVVVGSGMDSSRVKVGYYVRNPEGQGADWTEGFCVDGYCGHNGMAVEKREGDRRTPVGTYSFTQNFGSLADPGSILPYKQLDEDDYWVDDPESAYYNQMVSTREVEKDWDSAEHLIGVMPQYRYALALDHNTAERIPGMGSAIFLHGYHSWKTWTEGCIAIPEEQVKTLVQQADENTRIVIMPQAPQAVLE